MPDSNHPMEIVLRKLHDIIGFDYDTTNMIRVRGVIAEFMLSMLELHAKQLKGEVGK